LESSNVNLTNELVDLIAAQRNFQANSRALEVNSSLQQTVLQIR
jgi:flagellar hook protein FlgE